MNSGGEKHYCSINIVASARSVGLKSYIMRYYRRYMRGHVHVQHTSRVCEQMSTIFRVQQW